MLWLMLAVACGKGPGVETTKRPTAEGLGQPPVILISIDTLRSDRLPAYGYQGVQTPHIDRLRQDSILYQHAYSHVPLTFPSHASLFTGWLPAEHGVRDNVGYTLDRERLRSGEIPYLPLMLQRQGYATGAGVSTFVLRGELGLDEGFDFYEDSIEFRTRVGLGSLQRPGLETLELSRDWLRQQNQRPFLYFFHLYEPHTPYAPTEPFASRYASPYDAEIAVADQAVGALLEELRQLQLYDRALILLFSDHGEGLGDHGEEEHGVLLYREAIQVPLMLKLPTGVEPGDLGPGSSLAPGSTVERPVQLIDILPTLVDLLGLESPEALPGLSLLAGVEPGSEPRRAYAETFYPRLHFGWSELTSLIDGRHQYIEGPDPELYDLQEDPAQRRNVLAAQRRTYAALRQELAGYDRELQPPAAVDDESREALAALGYIGGGVTPEEGPLPDPKTRLDTLADLKNGFRHHTQGQYEEAAAAFRQALEENPRMLDAWEYLGRSLHSLGRRREALDAYQEGLRISQGAPHLAMAASSLFFDLGQLEDAESHARLALPSHTSFAHGLLAQIALARDDLDLAEQEARLALDTSGPRVGPRITLAEVQHARGELQPAMDLLDEALRVYGEREAQDPSLIEGLHLLRGKILADSGEVADAEAAFRKEIELFPDGLRAYSSLALLYALSGRPREAVLTLQGMVEGRPAPDTYAEAVRTLRVMENPEAAAGLLRHALTLFPGDQDLLALRQS